MPHEKIDPLFQSEGENEFTNFERNKQLALNIVEEAEKADRKLHSLMRLIDQKDIEMEKTIERLFDDKLN